jgi:anti-sigma B factor antagonist
MVEQSGDSVGSTGFQVGESQVGQAVVLAVSGEVDALTAPRLAGAIHTALATGPAILIVDLSKVRFFASAGMTVLVAAKTQAGPATRFGVVADNAATSRPIKLMGIDAVLPLYRTLDRALSGIA